jgi:predicted SnoaL-like aldol condensation-catalyzing enzyme
VNQSAPLSIPYLHFPDLHGKVKPPRKVRVVRATKQGNLAKFALTKMDEGVMNMKMTTPRLKPS